MDAYYDYIKSLHLIFVITWFAGLFYIVRLFVYHIEANEKPSPEKEILIKQYKLMSYRLWYIITWPSAILASLFAFLMIFGTVGGGLAALFMDACKTVFCVPVIPVPLEMPSHL